MASPASPEFVPFTDKLWVEQIRPSFIGGLIAFLLLGVSLVQFKRVFRLLSRGNQTEVSRTSKLTWTLLVLLFLANITDTVAKSHYLSTLIQGCAVNGVAYLSGKYPKSAFFYASVDATIASLTHIAFIRRTLKLVGNARDYFRDKARAIMVVTYGLLILIAALSLTSLAASIVESFIIINIKFPELEKIDITLALWLGGSTAADILLSAVFSFHLAYQRKAASSHQTVDLVDKWMTLSLQTGLAPAVLNLLHLVWFYAQEELGYHYAVSFWTPVGIPLLSPFSRYLDLDMDEYRKST
ncbi:hypothetical protein BT69DRAFT_166021 [Atractiella rhizophila]|nr:hypothetical protein BT69DRAFT_166021 [Atractiella rhizophila]